MYRNCIVLGLLVVSSTSCAWLGLSDWNFWGTRENSLHASNSRSPLPKVPSQQQPGGSGYAWRYLGVSDDGLLVDEINAESIKVVAASSSIYSFMDRKTVVDVDKFSYQDNQPHFKYLIATWYIDCANQSYLLKTAALYDTLGKLIKYKDYTASDVKWLRFGDGSFAQMEYNFVCLGINRNLGY